MPIVSSYVPKHSNGAGDAFFAGFLYGYAHGYSVEHCLQLATIVSSLCITPFVLASPDPSAARVAADYHRYYPNEAEA